jgi:hypothetical protein
MRALVPWLFFGTVAIAIAVGCADDDVPPDPIYTPGPLVPPASSTIGPSGGTVTSSDGASIVVPPGALEVETAITIASDPSAPLTADMTAVGTPVSFAPEGLRFAKPVRLTLPLFQGRADGQVGLFRAPRTTISYEALPGATHDGVTITVEASTLGVVVPAIVTCVGGCTADVDAGTCTCSGRCLGAAYALRCGDAGCTCQDDASAAGACGDRARIFREGCRFPGQVAAGE